MPSTLSPADWKKVVKENPGVAEADALTKALDSLTRADGKDDPASLVGAIDAVIAKAEAAKKKNGKSKEVVGYLDKLLKEARAERQDAEARAKAKEKKEAEEAEGHEGAILKAQIKRVTKLKAEEAKPFVVALGKVSGLVITRGLPAGAEHKKRARAMRVGRGKLLLGECHGEKGRVVFVFKVNPPGGLAKALKKAILIHCELPTRVLVRGPQGEFDDENDLDEIADLGTDDEDEAAETETQGETQAQTRGGVDAGKTDSAAFAAAARAVKARLDALRDADAGRAAPLTSRYASALGHAQGGRYAEGLALLKALDGETAAAGEAAASAPKTEPTAPTKAASKVVLQQSRLAWEAARKKVLADGEKLADAILDRFQGQPDLDEATATADRVRASLGLFSDELADALDRAFNAEDPAARARLQGEAAALICDYLAELDADPVYALMDENPYLPVSVHKTLSTALKTLAGKLA